MDLEFIFVSFIGSLFICVYFDFIFVISIGFRLYVDLFDFRNFYRIFILHVAFSVTLFLNNNNICINYVNVNASFVFIIIYLILFILPPFFKWRLPK